MRNTLGKVIDSNVLVVINLIISTLLWVPDFIGTDLSAGYIFTLLGTYLAMVVNAVLLMLITLDMGVTRTQSTTLVALYMLFIGSLSTLHVAWKDQLVVLAFLLASLLTLKTFRKPHAVEESLLATILLCLASLLIPDILLFIPMLWLMFYVERSLNLRVWLASLIGVGVTLIYAAIMQHFGWICLGCPSYIVSRTYAAELSTWQIVQLSTLAFESLLALCFAVAALRDEIYSIQSYLICFGVSMFLSAIMMFFPPEHFSSLLPITILGLTALLTYYFNKKHTTIANILFLLHNLVWIGLGVFSQIIP